MSGSRIGIRGFHVNADGIIYAMTEADGLRKLAAGLLALAEAAERDTEPPESAFARGGLRIEEMST